MDRQLLQITAFCILSLCGIANAQNVYVKAGTIGRFDWDTNGVRSREPESTYSDAAVEHRFSYDDAGDWYGTSTNSNDGTQATGGFESTHSTNNGGHDAFDGGDDRIDITVNGAVDTSMQAIGNNNGYAVMCWIQTEAVSPAGSFWFPGDCISEVRHRSGAAGTKVAFSFGLASNKVSFGRTDNYTTTDERWESTSTVTNASWKHIACVVDDDDLDFYIDGMIDRSVTFVTATGDCSVSSSTSDFRVGSRSRDNGVADEFYEGSLDDWRVYDRVITSGEVFAVFTDATGIH